MTALNNLPFHDELERILVNHCSPVLFGGKPSALFIVKTEKCYSCLMGLINQIDNTASSTVLRKNQNGLLVLVYKSAILSSVIMKPEINRPLRSFGYPEGTSTLRSYMDILKNRVLTCGEFPHEIGLFLGYPPDDVAGFIEHKGENYKYCGLWKVYGNVENALSLFQHYENCREKIKAFLAA
jgi:hypothetical protein